MNFTWLMRPGTASAFTPKPLTPFKYMLRLGEGGGRRVGGHWANVPPPSKILRTLLSMTEYDYDYDYDYD